MLIIKRPQYKQMLSMLDAAYPNEGCGFLAGRREQVHAVYAVENKLHSHVAFAMEPRQQIAALQALEGRRWTLLAVYHSHPLGPDTPSAADVTQANYPEAAQLIVSFQDRSRPSLRAFQIDAGEVEEIRFSVQP